MPAPLLDYFRHRVCRDVGSETIINLKSPIISIFVSCGLVFFKKKAVGSENSPRSTNP